MTDYIIPCDTIARLAPVADANPSERMRLLRLDGGQVIATSGKVMVIENIGFDGPIVHISIDETLRSACAREAMYNSRLTITVTEILSHAIAKTTYGYIHAPNIFSATVNQFDFDRWREIAMRAGAPLVEPGPHGMCWELDQLELIMKASPSGRIALERNIDAEIKPVFMTDAIDPNWLAIARPHDTGDAVNPMNPAKFPSWMGDV